MLFSVLGSLVADPVHLNPTGAGLPGVGGFQKLIDGLGQVALWGALAGIIIGALSWALGRHIGNGRFESNGRLILLASAAAAGLVAAAPAIVNYMHQAFA